MFERFRRMLGGISLKILLSYLSILLIPLLAVILIYSVSSNALLNYQKCALSKLTALQETEGFHPKWNEVTFKQSDWPWFR